MPKAKPTAKEKSKRLQHLEANKLTLFDTAGKPRIYLDAGNEDGYASISVYSKNQRMIQIYAGRDNEISLVFRDCQLGGNVQLGMHPTDGGGLWISAPNGGLGAVLGREPETETHRLMLFKNGKHFWNTPTGVMKPKVARKKTGANVAAKKKP